MAFCSSSFLQSATILDSALLSRMRILRRILLLNFINLTLKQRRFTLKFFVWLFVWLFLPAPMQNHLVLKNVQSEEFKFKSHAQKNKIKHHQCQYLKRPALRFAYQTDCLTARFVSIHNVRHSVCQSMICGCSVYLLLLLFPRIPSIHFGYCIFNHLKIKRPKK